MLHVMSCKLCMCHLHSAAQYKIYKPGHVTPLPSATPEHISTRLGVGTGRVWASTCGMYSLQRLLDSQDAVLGPAVPGRDPLLDALNSFVGTPGSPAVRPWEQGLPNQTDPAGQLAGLSLMLAVHQPAT